MKPGRSLFIAALLWLVLGAGAFFSESLSLVWFLSGVTLLPFLIADALFLVFFTDRLSSERKISNSLALGQPAAVQIYLRRNGKGIIPFGITLFDMYPASMKCQAFPARLDRKLLKEGASILFEYQLIPAERGPWEFASLELLLASPLRFWRLRTVHETKNTGRTYPDFKKLIGSGGLDIRALMEKTGLKNIRKRGQGLEFMSLREYQLGDPVKNIDWRATSRRQKPIIREYQEEQDQQILILLDSGYRLHRREGEYTQFDSALNASLLLAYVALKHEDTVAMASFGNGERWLQPRKGMSTLTALMNSLYDLHSAPVPSSPFSALETALSRLNRRTFIVLISNLREEDGESLSWILPRIQRRHLFLAVSLREKEAEELSRKVPVTLDDSMEKAAAFSYLYSRKQLYKTWEHSGLLTMEASAEELSSELINRYLSLKRSGQL
ncbi:DUF58 domain-containing protein [Breznakiella homolactica]|uniref:DUF58 domain-containing protein n=1 Tax=Breznakiella homolactica TaxID=2798577 RepID=A0A7T7XQ90_9SPIR|nr:DUF58 domain-containing protein [Breznakiella homolactica]QQO10478.1 DUF58 domain-containing protein [Breznakiella homolactica]